LDDPVATEAFVAFGTIVAFEKYALGFALNFAFSKSWSHGLLLVDICWWSLIVLAKLFCFLLMFLAGNVGVFCNQFSFKNLCFSALRT
jgi:hypothetical protein